MGALAVLPAAARSCRAGRSQDGGGSEGETAADRRVIRELLWISQGPELIDVVTNARSRRFPQDPPSVHLWFAADIF